MDVNRLSDVDHLGDLDGKIHIDAKVADRALDSGMVADLRTRSLRTYRRMSVEIGNHACSTPLHYKCMNSGSDASNNCNFPRMTGDRGKRATDARIAHAMLLIEQKMGEDVRMEEIARELDLSLHHFHRLFVAKTGETPAAFLRRIRLDAAALQLQRSSQPAGSIAHTRGYNSQAAFTRAFQGQFGASPLQYRREKAPASQPDARGAFKITVAELASFRLLAMRFVGLIWGIDKGWDKFQSTLPKHLDVEGTLYVGQLHNSPGLLVSPQTRYDCCTILAPDVQLDDALLNELGMVVTETRAGPYACLPDAGPGEAMPAAYDALCNQWLPQSGYHATDDPVLEVFDSAPARQEDQLRRCAIMLPIE